MDKVAPPQDIVVSGLKERRPLVPEPSSQEAGYTLLAALCNPYAAEASSRQASSCNPVHVAADTRRNGELLSEGKGAERDYPQPVTVWAKLYGFLCLHPVN